MTLAEGRFQTVIDDESAASQASKVRRLVLCSGKIAVDLITSEQRKDNQNVAIARVEQVYPFPERRSARAASIAIRRCGRCAGSRKSPRTWARGSSSARFSRSLLDGRTPLRYIGRVRNSSPSEGSAAWHAVNQRAIVEQVFEAKSETKELERVLSKQV